MKNLFLISFFSFVISSYGQNNCDYKLTTDSCSLQNSKMKELVEFMEVKIKSNYFIQFIKLDKKVYLKIIVRDNLGFGKKGSLLLLSNKKQIYIRSLELQIIDKSSAYFLIALNETNYLENIKEFGLTSILFNETAEFSIPKSDSDQIKKAANCFYEFVKDNLRLPVKKL